MDTRGPCGPWRDGNGLEPPGGKAALMDCVVWGGFCLGLCCVCGVVCAVLGCVVVWGSEQIRKTQDEPQWIVAQGLLSALTIPGFS